jgi:hypothetical protein
MKTRAKSPVAKSNPETTFIPVVTMVEAPILSDEEREELLTSLKEAEADIEAGRTTPFDRASFKARFMAICRGEIE